MSAGIERRSFEFRADESGRIEGVAIPYNSPGTVADFSERFAPGSISFQDVILNLQHDRKRPLARTDGGGLELRDGPDALRAKIELPDTADGRDVRTLIQRRVLRGLSVEFRAIRDSWQGNERTIYEAELSGLAIVDRPAYAGATVAEIREAVEAMQYGRETATAGRRTWLPVL